MAKQPAQAKGRDAHVRLIVLEATLPDGDVSQLAQAIQNALRPSQTSQARVATSAAPVSPPQIEGAVVDVEEESHDPVGEIAPTPRVQREPRARRVSVPEAIDLADHEIASWQEFFAKRDADKEIDRYLCVAAWSKEFRKDEPITAEVVYTCYRLAKWSVAIDDFGAHLRTAKAAQYLKQVSRGEYRITQIGLQKVEELVKG